MRIPTKSAGDSDDPSHLLGLARNGRDSHTLLEFCGLVGTLIVDRGFASPIRAIPTIASCSA